MRRLLQPLERFARLEAAGGIALLVATLIALLWASSPWSSTYHALWHTPITLGWSSWLSHQSLQFWINDGLMTIFFLLVGLEIRREMHDGALATVRLAALPLIAAAGGVMMPAVIFLALNDDPLLRHAWAVPTATDIAFAVGVLTLLGKRVPVQLRVLLLAIAIIDDIAAILIIAMFYTSGLKLLGLLIAACGIVLVFAMQRLGIGSPLAYALPGIIVWSGMLHAGVHPSLAGVALGLLTPVVPSRARAGLLAAAAGALRESAKRLRHDRDARALPPPVKRFKFAQREMLPPLLRVETALHPWVAFGIVPLFALANAGVDLRGVGDALQASASLTLGIALGLVLGKPIGIALATWLSLKLRLAALAEGIDARGVLLIGCLGGIGFTMSIFIANLAFTSPELLSASKLAVLMGSACAAVIGLALGRTLLLRRASCIQDGC
ncbi:sodium:proton antiporter [Steroidobacter denitrificans]|uniref:Na(+)/H(+) antiporter NhaA n=1 Tax=Steroidobacter denitrificans TaxID=465721 RepID=A0A127F5H8_STEDE|nr:sodium:proton antiporter [Steroidobacter denitrificans]